MVEMGNSWQVGSGVKIWPLHMGAAYSNLVSLGGK